MEQERAEAVANAEYAKVEQMNDSDRHAYTETLRRGLMPHRDNAQSGIGRDAAVALLGRVELLNHEKIHGPDDGLDSRSRAVGVSVYSAQGDTVQSDLLIAKAADAHITQEADELEKAGNQDAADALRGDRDKARDRITQQLAEIEDPRHVSAISRIKDPAVRARLTEFYADDPDAAA
jgi:hypothetical protein